LSGDKPFLRSSSMICSIKFKDFFSSVIFNELKGFVKLQI
jgi:hypothetical protein